MLGKLVVKPIVKPDQLKLGTVCCKKLEAYTKLGSEIAYEIWLSQQPKTGKKRARCCSWFSSKLLWTEGIRKMKR